MRAFCALMAIVCFGLFAVEIYFHLFSGIAMVFNFITAGYRR